MDMPIPSWKIKSSPKSAEIQIFMAHPRIELGATIADIPNCQQWDVGGTKCYGSINLLRKPRTKSATEWGSTIVQNIGGMEHEGTHYRSSALSFESRACVPNFHSVVKTKNVIWSNDLPPDGTGVLL
ncbi:hypothetical protein B0H14DRAFT_2605521 [Mycena olivaceomarginata]|nr:hypothetical protein B0H14DRAFT_2605521 [Mycena olivaceomarginata]